MSSTKSFINTFMLAIATVAITACVPKATEKKAVCGVNQAFSTVSRSCYSIEELRVKPVGTTSTAAMEEEIAKTITLAYTDGNKDKAISCKVTPTSTSLELVSPSFADGGLLQAADDLAQTLDIMVAALSAPAASIPMKNTFSKAQASVYYPTVVTQLGIFNTEATSLLESGEGVPSVEGLYNQALIQMKTFTAMMTGMTNRCECSGGVCSTVAIPKLNKTGAAGFSYTVTDADGEGATKSVAVTIATTTALVSNLQPVGQSSFYTAGESATSIPASYAITIADAGDIAGTPLTSHLYKFKIGSGFSRGDGPIPGVTGVSGRYGITPKGIVYGCMDLYPATSPTNDKSCIYIPNDGDVYDLSALHPNATIPMASDATVFTAKATGIEGNSLTVQYLDIKSAYPNSAQVYGQTGSSEAFIRVVGNDIKIYINPGETTAAQISALVAAHPQASKMVTATAGGGAPLPSAVMTLATSLASFDKIPFTVNNTKADSTNSSAVSIRITSVNDAPMVPKTYNGSVFAPVAYVHDEELIEDTAQAVTLNFKDVDSAGFTVTTKFDTLFPTCATGDEATMTSDFLMLSSSTNLALAQGAISCNASNECTLATTVTPQLNFTGNACLYYTVSDGAGVSYVQGVNIKVKAVNDAPLISETSFLPTDTPAIITALGTTPRTINEDLAPGHNSYADIYVSPGGGGSGNWESYQSLTVTATSSVTTLIPNVTCKNYTPGLVTPVNNVTPTAAGLYYFDRVDYKCYISTGTTSASWKLYPSLTAYPNCAFDFYGQGTPTITSAVGKRYLDTTNNKCYISTSASSSSWSQDKTLQNYKVVYVPMPYQSSGTAIDITVTVHDDGGKVVSTNDEDTADDIIKLTVDYVNNPPVFVSTITTVETNEGGAVQSNAFVIDEDEGSTVDEDVQGITITGIATDNASVLPTSAITIFYDLNNNGVEDNGEKRCIVGDAACLILGGLTTLEGATPGMNVNIRNLYLKIDPVDGISGNVNVSMTISDGTNPATTNFSVIVHPIAALHGGWTNISSVGLKTDKTGAPAAGAEIVCNYDTDKCGSGGACKSTSTVTSPNGIVVPSVVNAIYWDSSNLRCYRSTGTTAHSWVDMNTSCPITRIPTPVTTPATTPICSGTNCINIVSAAPEATGIYKYVSSTNKCYLSKGTTDATDWVEYTPAKVTLSWKPFIMVGSGADSNVQIAGWNVYRRDAGTDYNFKGGHLKNSTSNTSFSITDPSVRTFTDTTAIAGRVYYYVVRPVDNLRHFPTHTPESFSEVRVIASPSNYSFVHRWMVNQEMCNGMNITTTTSPNHVDQTQNFRCEYSGPGSITDTGVQYYDYGRDLLVDTQEAGCAYAAAPSCTSTRGCIGIGNPTTLGYSANADDLYYDRSSGACYANTGGGWTEIEDVVINPLFPAVPNKINSALNAPLTNVSRAQAASICSARTVPALTYNLAGAVATINPVGMSTILPNKKDYMGYASQKLNVTDPEVTEMEQGFSLNIQSRCNGSSASGLETAYTDSAIPSTSFIYSLPGTFSSGIRSLYTGSIPWSSSKGTEACVSRFGIQDLYGNVAEWVNDGFSCEADPYRSKVCTVTQGAPGSFTATDFGTTPYKFDNVVGPFNEGGDSIITYPSTTLVTPIDDIDTIVTVADSSIFPATGILVIGSEQMTYSSNNGTDLGIDARGVNGTTAVAHAAAAVVTIVRSDDSYLTNWTFGDQFFGANYFNYPLGIPLSSNINQAAFTSYLDWALSIGPSSGITTNKLHEDGIIVNGSAGAVTSFAVGGSYLSGNRAGRFSSELISDSVLNRPDVGFRCIVPVVKTKYPPDAAHDVYPY